MLDLSYLKLLQGNYRVDSLFWHFYMDACNLGAMICHLRDLTYEFEHLGTPEYNIEGRTKEVPSVLLIDNQATVRMSKDYKVTSKNRHVGRCWHFVR